MTVVIRTATIDPSSLIPSARSIVASLDPQLPVTGVKGIVGALLLTRKLATMLNDCGQRIRPSTSATPPSS